MESIRSRCDASNIAISSPDDVKNALASCNGDEEEAVATLVRSSFLHNIYAGYDRSVEDRMYQQRSRQLNEELSALLKDESLPRDVSCYMDLLVTVTQLNSTLNSTQIQRKEAPKSLYKFLIFKGRDNSILKELCCTTVDYPCR